MTVTYLHGGGDSVAARSTTFGRFAQAYLAAPRGPLLIVATGQTEDEVRETTDYYCGLFADLNVRAEWLVPVPVKSDRPLTGEQIAVLAPSGIFVCGGVTPFYHQALCSDLTWVDYIRAGSIPYGGTSAGAVIAADSAILGGWQTPDEDHPRQILFPGAGEGLDCLTIRPGASLVPFAIDVHAGQMGTLMRLVHAVASGMVAEGWAVDEDTMLIIDTMNIEIDGIGQAYRVERVDDGHVTVQVFAAPANYGRKED